MNKDKKFKRNEQVGYSGKVEVGLYRKGKKIRKLSKNAGTYALFEYLCGCLAGSINANYDIGKRPGKIRLYDASGNALLTFGVSFNDFEIKKNPSKLNPSCSITFNFLVPGATILNKSVKKVKLFDIQDETIYAEADFDSTIKITSTDTNIYVAWTLTIYNGQL